MKISDIQIDRLRIVEYPEPVLRKTCWEVTEFGPKLEALCRKMLEIMRADRGIGLAGPQVGLPLRLFVCNTTADPANDLICVNPALEDFEGGDDLEEGCLSLPEVAVPVRRPGSVTLRAVDPHGNPFTQRSSDLLARVWQHENDHLDGRMIIDYMSTESALANRRALKLMEENYRRRTRRRTAGIR